MAQLIASLRHAFETRARSPALEGDQWQLDYRDLAHDSAALAAELARLGVRAGDHVALAMPRSPQMVVAMVALLRCGAAYAPIDLGNPSERVAAMLDTLASPLILTGPGVPLPTSHAALGVDLHTLLAGAAAPGSTPPWPEPDEDAVACVMFTSGSTGAPKAVRIPHRGIARLVRDTDYAEFRADARWAHAASPAFDASLLEIWGALLNGACCVVQERPLPGLHELAGFLAERRITDAWLTAALFNTMVDDQLDALGGLRQLLTGGETMSVAHARACVARWPSLRLINGYGPTENTTFSLTHHVDASELANDTPAPIGRPIAGTRVRIEPAVVAEPASDADTDTETAVAADVGAGAAADADAQAPHGGANTDTDTGDNDNGSSDADATHGELWVGGDGLALGYLGDAGETARRFVTDADGLAWYRTGDAVTRRADGVFLFHGRIDRQVKLRGHRVDLDALERLLATAPGVLEAALLVVGDAADSRRLVACVGVGVGAGAGADVSLEAGGGDRAGVGAAAEAGADVRAGTVQGTRIGAIAPDPSAWRDWLATRVAPAALPAQWIVRARLPQNASGKLDRATLRAWAMAGVDSTAASGADANVDTNAVASSNVRADTARDIVPPDAAPPMPPTPTESALISLWARQFPGVAPHRLSDYRACGGHSLAALRLAADIRRELGRRVDAIDLLRVTRLDAQARLVDLAPRVAAETGPADAQDAEDLSVEQLAVLQADALDVAGTAYLVHCAWVIAPGLTPARLRAAFEAVANRHPALRLAWRRDAERVGARTLPRAPADLVRHHAPLAAAPTDAQWPGDVLATLRRRLDTTTGPMRVDLWPLLGDGLLCALTLHHVVIDAWSLDRVRIEIDAWLRGEPPDTLPTPSDPTPVDRAGLQRQATALARDWAGRRPALESLATRAPGPGGDIALALPGELGAAAHALARRGGFVAYAPLLVAWGIALQSVFGDASRHVVVPFARRRGPDADRAIGYHLDLRLLAAGVAPGETPADALARVNDELLQAQRPWRRPLTQLADALSTHDASLREWVTQFSFTWQPDRTIDFALAGVAARDVAVPLGGARFGLALHLETAHGAPRRLVARIEALQPLFDDGRALAAGQAFVAALESLGALAAQELAQAPAARRQGPMTGLDVPDAPSRNELAQGLAQAPAARQPAPSMDRRQPASPLDERVPSALFVRAASAAWAGVLDRPPAGHDDDFLLAGGSSLLATRLASRLRRDLGRDLDLAAFLADPRFGALCAVLARAPAGRPRAVLRLGHANARRVVLLIPGGAGGPLGLYTLATALRECLPEDWALAIVDLGALMQDAPSPPSGDYFAARLRQIARDLDVSRLAGIVGFSLGGLMAMDLASALGREAPPLCLLDTYAPQRMRLDAPARAARLVIQFVHGPAATLAWLRARREPPQPGSVEADRQYPRWRELMARMALRPVPAGVSRVTLIRSRTGSVDSGILRRKATNGFRADAFASLELRTLPYDHLGLLRDGATAVAEAIAQALVPASRQDGVAP